jgi:SAM-dependent methyltransferase
MTAVPRLGAAGAGTAAADAFRAFEHDGWERATAAYDDAFGPLTHAAAGPLLDAAGVRRGTLVLDVASGPGQVAAAAAQRGARPAGIDFSAAMVEQARRRYPALEFREGDAEALDLPDASCDAVVMNFGLLHLGRPELAVAEAYRVLRPRGRFAFTVWCRPEEAVGFGILLRAVEAHGTLDVQLPPAPPFFRFSDPGEAGRILAEAGFTGLLTGTVPLVWRLPTPASLFQIMLTATVRTAGLLRAQPPGAHAAIRVAVAEEAGRYLRRDIVELPMPALLASGAKP